MDQATEPTKTLSPEDRDWQQQPVNVQVPHDNQKWLDALMEMNHKELVDFAIYRYQVPKAAAEVSNRNDLIQLVVLANQAGGGGSVLRHRFRYLNRLKGLVPQYTQKVRGGRYLYMTRGEGDSMQVYNKKTEQWVSISDVQNSSKPAVGKSDEPELPKTPAAETPAPQATPPAPTGNVIEQVNTALSLVLPALPKMTRKELEAVVKTLGVKDTSEKKFPTNGDLVEYIRNAAGQPAEPNAKVEGE